MYPICFNQRPIVLQSRIFTLNDSIHAVRLEKNNMNARRGATRELMSMSILYHSRMK